MARKNAPIQMPHGGDVPHGIRFRVPWRIHQKAADAYNNLGHEPIRREARRARRIWSRRTNISPGRRESVYRKGRRRDGHKLFWEI